MFILQRAAMLRVVLATAILPVCLSFRPSHADIVSKGINDAVFTVGVLKPIDSSRWQYKVHRRIREKSPLARALNLHRGMFQRPRFGQ